ncbi:uncharacterized protein Z519_10808 [Cladophialophora bantiana CBS 173.52]|uniref:Uncharacterized protein n=1 Tax=Cladophialophora bantiana (strain ATCC 10958 / CBS 173.52 / CDC B-1940 / NIH 8579) TaxID=1442370 RepID=A0A0D2EFA2_CLAB1|nr:uncharacterized protein Z519_10808 [Cladophialophora bantiana CBS 173.52]KIW88761.1 hypothetical protein Z519_10808 [Cladophialophora bantiana CBS 173.52]
MLALKSMKLPYSGAEHWHATKEKVQLPSEVLDLIAELLYEGSYRQLDSLLPFSLVSRQFRKSALPFLFGTVSHVIRDRLDQRKHGLLSWLLDNRHLLGYVHTLHVQRPLEIPDFSPPQNGDNGEHYYSDLRAVRESLPLMHRLRRIRLDCSAAAAYQVLKMLADDQQYEVILGHLYTSSPWPDMIQATTAMVSIAGRHQLALGAFGAPPFSYPEPDQATYDAVAKAAAVDLHMAWLLDSLTVVDSETPHLRRTPSWTELRLIIPRHAMGDLNLIPWENLRRLSIVWGNTVVSISEFIYSSAPRLIQLQALRICADHQRHYHPTCPYAGTMGPLFENDPGRPFAIDFTQMTELRELEIDGICNHIPITDLVGPNLRHLRLHCEDSRSSVYSKQSQRSHTDILTAAKLAPKIERLELDVGYIEHLWHPTAIPGVDVHVEQYAFLNALTKFRHLRFLRLFPPFISSSCLRLEWRLHHTVPVSDIQAIRVFDQLQRECPSLQLLSIAAAPSVVDIDTMYWQVTRQKDKTILTTGHRARNYKHCQTWIGNRRMRSEIKRFNTPQVYLPDSDGWMLTRNDLHDVRQIPFGVRWWDSDL